MAMSVNSRVRSIVTYNTSRIIMIYHETRKRSILVLSPIPPLSISVSRFRFPRMIWFINYECLSQHDLGSKGVKARLTYI